MRTLTGHDGLPLHWREWGADPAQRPQGTLLIVHGLGEHIGRYAHVARRLNAWGWHVVGYDQRGHGASGGARGDIPEPDSLQRDLSCAIDAVRSDARMNQGPLVLLGHSMGGAVAASFVAGALVPTEWSRLVDGLVLSSPALDVGMSLVQRGLLATTLPLVPHVAVGNGLNPAWLSRDPAVVEAYKDDPLVHNRITPMLAKMLADTGPSVMAYASRWPVPTLLMWAGADRCVAPAGSASFAAAARKSGDGSGVEAELFEPLFHEIFNEPEQDQVFDRLKSWLAARF